MNGLSTAISSAGSAIGRYFSIVSFIPSLFLVSFTFALIKSGAWHGSPDWAEAGDAFTNIGNLALITLVSIAFGIIVHPVQFALVQFFEGYWGTGGLAQRARASRIMHHRTRYRTLRLGPGPKAQMNLRDAAGPKERIERLSLADESRRLARGYPDGDDNIMPTRLGNVMRRYERHAGSSYGLDAVKVIRHIAFVAPPQQIDYLNDQREQLDLAVRMSATSILATLIAIAFLWHDGAWLIIALIPYCIAYLSYRGAVVVAHEYGGTVSAIIDLDRFALYEYLRMPSPKSTKAERRMNAQLMQLLDEDDGEDVIMRYDQPDAASAAKGELQAN